MVSGIGAVQTEADLRAAILREIGNLPELVRQLQSASVFKIAGAVGDGVADDTGPLHDWFAKHEGREAVLPAGRFRYTETPTAPQGMGMRGVGLASQLLPDGCDGLNFAVSNDIAPIRWSNFALIGAGSSEIGIKAMGDGDTGRTTGVTFGDVFVRNFTEGMRFRSLWSSRIVGVTMLDVWRGIVFQGQAVNNKVSACEILRGAATGSGDATGVLVDEATDYTSGASNRRPEDVQVSKTRLYGFDIGIDHVRCLFAGYHRNDLDAAKLVGIRFNQTAGGLTIARNYVALSDAAALYGIYGNAAFTPNASVLEILANTLRTTNTINVASVGILLDTDQHEALIAGNNMQGFRNSDIYLNECRRATLLRNACVSSGTSASIRASHTRDVKVDENEVAVGYDVGDGTNQAWRVGATHGAVSTLVEAHATLTAGSTSVAVTFAGLPGPPPDFDSAGGLAPKVQLVAPPANLGAMWVTSVSDTGFTINCATAPGSNTTLRFVVSSYLPGY